MDVSYGNEPSLAYGELPPYSPVRGSGEGFLDEKKDDGIAVRIARTWTETQVVPKKITRTASDFLQQRTWPAIRDTTATHVTPVLSSSSRATWNFVQNRMWKGIKDYPLKATQLWGLLLLALGIVPFVVYGRMYRGWVGTFYYGAFSAKTIGCGNALGVPQNSTVEGVEALFALDWKFGQLSFARVKTIDVAWDIFVGRGIQMVFWAISYRVFSDALLHLIERHPASFETFKSITLEGPGLGTSWELFKQLFRNRTIRTWFLFFYLLLSSFYVMSIPPLLSAMTGYDGTTIAWVSIGDPDNIIPTSQLDWSYVVYGTHDERFDKPICDDTTQELRDWSYHQQDMENHCDCQLPNSTVLPYSDWIYYRNSLEFEGRGYETPYKLDDCDMRYPDQSGVYQSTWGQDVGYEPAKDWGIFKCNETFPVTLTNNKTYSMYDLRFDNGGWCFQEKYYQPSDLYPTTRCLPDTANPSYQWGFSSAMMGVVFILNVVWCLTMWMVWQDALSGKLVRSGYRMSPLRAAFALTEAARRRTGMVAQGLVQREATLLRREMRRGRGRREAVVDKNIFEEGGGDNGVEVGMDDVDRIRRRPVAGRHVDIRVEV